MADSPTTDTDDEDRSLVDELHWVLIDQYDESSAGRIRNALVLISLATSFLSFVGATSALLASPSLLWVGASLGLLGFLTLAFTWLLALGEFDGLIGEASASANE